MLVGKYFEDHLNLEEQWTPVLEIHLFFLFIISAVS